MRWVFGSNAKRVSAVIRFATHIYVSTSAAVNLHPYNTLLRATICVYGYNDERNG